MRGVLLVGLVLLAGCAEEPSEEQRAAEAERDIALVERANASAPPVEELTPEPIGAPDMEQHDLLGPGCAYAPGTSLAARVIAREADAYVKLDGEMERFAADSGSRELPAKTRSVYNSGQRVLQLRINGAGEATPSGQTSYDGSITLRDPHGRVVYEGAGLVRCDG